MTERKTAQELRITEDDYRDLLATRAMLAAPSLPTGFVFNMMSFVVPAYDKQMHECGTACCIGGTMMMLRAGVKPEIDDLSKYDVRLRIREEDVDTTGPMMSLFYPAEVDRPWEDITAAEGVQAIDNFLAGNIEKPWHFIHGE